MNSFNQFNRLLNTFLIMYILYMWVLIGFADNDTYKFLYQRYYICNDTVNYINHNTITSEIINDYRWVNDIVIIGNVVSFIEIYIMIYISMYRDFGLDNMYRINISKLNPDTNEFNRLSNSNIMYIALIIYIAGMHLIGYAFYYNLDTKIDIPMYNVYNRATGLAIFSIMCLPILFVIYITNKFYK